MFTRAKNIKSLGEDSTDMNQATKHEESDKTVFCYVIDYSKKSWSSIASQIRKWLTQLRQLFARGLPSMPKNEIKNRVLDTEHKNLILVKDGRLVGGICFKTFRSANFSEIALCAVKKTEQRKGYGTYMMTQLKDYHVKYGYRHFLTYADNAAIGYFEKQGFTKNVTLPCSMYEGFIKVYIRATLMQFDLDPSIKYTKTAFAKRRRQRRMKMSGLKFAKLGDLTMKN